MNTLEPFFKAEEFELQQEFLRNVKVRSIEQKFLYFGEGMSGYYDLYNDSQLNNWNGQQLHADRWGPNNFEMFLEKHISKQERIGIISLGCGVAADDKNIMSALYKSGYNFSWIGFDSSTAMIEKARENFKDVDFDHQLHVSDVTSYDFYKQVESIMKEYDKIIVILIGGTIGNMVQTEIFDTVYNLMNPGDLFWFDCVTRASNSKTENLEVFNKYANRLNNPTWVKFVSHPLDFLHISRDVGDLILENTVEESIGVLNFRYSFRFKELCTAKFLDEYIHFVPPESIKLLDVRTYHPNTLIQYLEQHNFKRLESATIPFHGQFLFTRSEKE